MKQHTNNFRTALKTLGRELDVQLTYTENGETQIVELSDILNVTPIINGGIIKSVMKQLELELKVSIPQNTILNLAIGIKVGNSFEYMNYGNFIIRDEPIYNADTQSYSYICYDKMLYSMVDYEPMNIVYPITIRNYINTICTHLGLTFKNINDTFANYDKEIKNELYLDTEGKSIGYTFRDVLDELAQVTASTICINEETDELEIRYITETNDSIDEEFLKSENVKIKEKYGPVNVIVLSRAEADNIYYPNVIPENPCEIKIINNQIMNWEDRDTYMPDIYEKLNGLEYYINDFSSIGILWYELCDMYTINIGEDSYKCVLLNDEINVQQGLEELIYTNMPDESVTDYHKADTSDKKLKQTIFQVNKHEGQIQSIVSEIGDRSQKTTTITQDIDGIESAVQDIEDLTNIVSGIKTVSITDAYPNNDIIELHIYGNNSVFSYLYPRTNLYPSSTLYPHGDSKIKLTNSQGEQIVDLGIIEVLRQNAEVRDEAIIDYLGNISVIRRVNKDGTTKSNPTTTTLGQAHFTLVEGINTFEIVTYLAPIEVKYAMKSTLTDIFATRVEMNSSITQTAEAINSEVRKKVDETEFGTMIEQNSEYVKIAWNQISEFIQMMSINNNATFAILNEDGQLMMTLDKKGQHFYESDGTTMFGEMGVQKVDNQNFISFSVPTQYNSSIQDGMAWGVTTTSDGKFHPILYIKDFTMPPENSGGATGELQLDGCNLVLGAENGHIIAGGMKIVPEALGGITFAKSDDTPLLTILKGNVISGPSIYMLDNISFFKNQAGSNSFKIGDNSNYCLFADDGSINATKSVYCTGDITATNWLYGYAGIHSDGYVSGKAFIDNSRKEIKKNIEKYNENALEEILNTDIYKYNYKNEDDEKKKHIGFVIGDEYNYSKQITSLDDNNKEIGANIYSMVSIAFKAIQEQQEQIEKLQNEINKMKGENNGGVRKNDMGK